MVRALWSGATGMIAQQTAVDTIANNLANVNTVGYKTEQAQFKSLLYQTLQTKTTTADNETKPTSAQIGLGTRVSSIVSSFAQGNLTASDSTSDFAISGDGFFAVMTATGEVQYTRNGSFLWAVDTDGLTLTNSDGLPVLDSDGNKITLPSDYVASNITITGDGTICYPDENNNAQSLGITLGVWQFQNATGLEKTSGTLYAVTAASGPAINEATTTLNITRSTICQGYLEASNVQVADEMVDLIVAQRAYEMNSKVIQAADDMMATANTLRS